MSGTRRRRQTRLGDVSTKPVTGENHSLTKSASIAFSGLGHAHSPDNTVCRADSDLNEFVVDERLMRRYWADTEYRDKAAMSDRRLSQTMECFYQLGSFCL